MTIVEFLLAKLANDEVAANIAIHAESHFKWCDVNYESIENMKHGERWSPERVLADVQAKRHIVELGQHVNYLESQWEGPLPDKYVGYREAISSAVAALVLPYADDLDFNEDWRT